MKNILNLANLLKLRNLATLKIEDFKSTRDIIKFKWNEFLWKDGKNKHLKLALYPIEYLENILLWCVNKQNEWSNAKQVGYKTINNQPSYYWIENIKCLIGDKKELDKIDNEIYELECYVIEADEILNMQELMNRIDNSKIGDKLKRDLEELDKQPMQNNPTNPNVEEHPLFQMLGHLFSFNKKKGNEFTSMFKSPGLFLGGIDPFKP